MTNKIPEIDFDSYVPYYIQLIEALKEKIKFENLKPGDQLPSEPDMCDLYGVSRTVVRQALRELELQGLVSRQKGKGTFIAQPKIKESLVQKLTGFFQDMVERGHTPQTKVLNFEVIPAPSRISQLLELKPDTEVYCIERLRSVEGDPILIVKTYIPTNLVPGLEKENLETESLYKIFDTEYGLRITHGRRAIEAVAANQYEADLLQIEHGDPLVMLDSVSFLEDGTPIEYFHAVHRGDRSRFEVELVRLESDKNLEEAIELQEIELPPSNG